jgi:hypothetical protein
MPLLPAFLARAEQQGLVYAGSAFIALSGRERVAASPRQPQDRPVPRQQTSIAHCSVVEAAACGLSTPPCRRQASLRRAGYS